MDYMITNSNRKVYIRLNDYGLPVTCDKQYAQRFESSKAHNILENLPKTMKKFHFKVVAIPEIPQKEDIQLVQKVIQKKNYIPSEKVTRWIEKFGMCGDILNEARQRKEELLVELSNVDKEFSNIIHQIELEDKVNMYIGWQERNKIKVNREKRRDIKDEIMIVENVLKEVDASCLQRERIKKSVEGLADRKFTFRVVEEDCEK